jgi:hypothetical protein
MIQGGESPDLSVEARETLGVHCDRVRKYFDGNVPSEIRVRGAIHLTHAANANLVGDLVRADACAGSKHDGVCGL